MAVNVANYIKNLGKSLMYSGEEFITTELAPTTADFISTNKDVFKEIYAAARDMRKTMTRVKTSITKSKVYEAADLGWRSIQEDLRTGKFYNKEREDAYAGKALGMDMDMDDDFNFDFDIGDVSTDKDYDDDDWGSLGNITEGDMHISNAIEESTRISSEVVSNTVAKTGKYIADTNRASTHMLYLQGINLHNTLSVGLGNLRSGLTDLHAANAALLDFHNNNTLKYYESSLEKLEASNVMLKQMLDMQTKIYNPEQKPGAKEKTTFSDITTSGGMVNLKEYAEYIKKNLKNAGGSTWEMLMGGDKNILLSYAANPLKLIPDFIVKSLIPDTLKEITKSFDNTFGGLFAGLLNRLGYEASKDDATEFTKFINKIFGFKPTVDSAGPNVSKYEKGSIPFDGITKKSIVEVIPGYLRRIESLLSGQSERVFNFNDGKWLDAATVRQTFDQMYTDSVNSTFSDLRSDMKELMKQFIIENKADSDRFYKDIDTAFKRIYDAGGYQGIKDKDFFDGLGMDDATINFLRSYFINGQMSPELRKTLAVLPRTINENKETLNKRRTGSNEGGYSINNILNDNSRPDSYLEKNKHFNLITGSTGLLGTNPFTLKDETSGKNAYDYLYDIYSEIYTIRTNLHNTGTGITPSGGSGEGTSGSPIELANPYYRKESKKTALEEARAKESKDNDNFKDRVMARIENLVKQGRSYTELMGWTDEDGNADKEVQMAIYSYMHLQELKAKENSMKVEKKKDKKNYFIDRNGEKRSFLDAFIEAGTVGEKFKVISSGIEHLAKKPGDMLGSVIATADQKIYELIYGKKDEKGFLQAMVEEMKQTFSKLNDWINMHIIEKIKKKLDESGFTRKFNDFKAKANEEIDRYRQATKQTFTGAWNYTKDAVSSVYRPAVQAADGALDGLISIGTNAMDNIRQFLPAREERPKEEKEEDTTIPNNAYGNKYTKRGLAILSEGERVISADKNIYNPNRHKVDLKLMEEDEQNMVSFYEDLLNTNILNYSGYPGKKKKKNPNAKKRKRGSRNKQVSKPKKKKNIATEVQEQANEAISETKEQNAEMVKVEAEIKKVNTDIIEKVRMYAPDAFATGLLGTGIGLLSGIAGGPILGAAAGAAIGLAKNSSTMQEMLFGTVTTDEQGNATGRKDNGLISKKVQDFFKSSKFKDIAKFGVTGAVTGLFTPFGPVGGLLIGSSIGYAKHSEKIQEALFGAEDGLLNEERRDAIKKAYPYMGAGALVGMLTGPFGLVGNAMLGSAVGFATTTDTFQDIMFGEKDEDGKRTGGLLGGVRDLVLNPLADFGKKFAKETERFIADDLIKPIAGAVDPILTEIKYHIKNIFTGIPKIIEKIFFSVLGVPLSSFIKERFIEPAAKLLGTTFKALVNPAKFIISAPSKMIGGIGNMYRMKQIRQGRANYMTAQERIDFRNEHGVRNFLSKLRIPGAAGLLGGPLYDRYGFSDETMAGMDVEALTSVQGLLDTAVNSNKAYETQVRQKRNKVGKEVDKMFSDKRFDFINNNARERILRAINDGDKETAKALINNLKGRNGEKLSEKDRSTLYSKIDELGDDLLDARGRRDASKAIQDDAFKQLRQFGFTDLDRGSAAKLLANINKEIDAKKALETPEDKMISSQDKTTEAVKNQTEAIIAMSNRTNEILTAIATGKPIPVNDKIGGILADSGVNVNKLDIIDHRKSKAIDKSGKERKLDDSSIGSLLAAATPNDDGLILPGSDVTTTDNTGFIRKKKGLFSGITDKVKGIFNNLKGERVNPETGVVEVKSTDGSWVAKDAEEGQKAAAEKTKSQQFFTNVSDKLSVLTDTMKNYLFFWKKDKEDEEKKPWWKEALSWGAKILGIPIAISFLPKIYEWLTNKFIPAAKNVYEVNVKPWFDENVLPVIHPVVDTLKDIKYFILGVKDYLTGQGTYEQSGGLRGDIKGIFSNVVIPWFAGESPFDKSLDGLKGGLPGTLRYISDHWLGGVEIIVKYGIQGILQGITTFLPAILKGAIKGFGGFFKLKMGELFHIKANEDLSYLDNPSASLDLSKEMPDMYASNAGVKWANKILTYTDQFGMATTYENKDDGVNAALEDEREAAEASGDVEKVAEIDKKIEKYNENADRMKEIEQSGNPNSIRNRGEYGELLKEQEEIIKQTPGLVVNDDGTITNVDPEALEKANEEVNDVKSKIFAFDDRETAGEAAAGAVVRSTLTGLKLPKRVQSVFSGINNLVGKTKIGKLVSPVTEIVGKAFNTVIEGTATNKGIRTVVNQVSEGLINKFKDIVKKILTTIFNSDKVQKVFADGLISSAQKLTKESFEAATKKCTNIITKTLVDALGKASSKVIGKVSAFVSTGGAISILFAVGDFISGYTNANTILAVTEATFPEKLICGILKAINGVVTLGLVPEATIVSILTDTLLPLFGIDNDELKKRQEEAAIEAHDAGFDDVEAYNDSKKWINQAKTLLGNAWSSIISSFKDASDIYKQAMDSAYDPITAKSNALTNNTGTTGITHSAMGKGIFGRGKDGHLSQLDSAYNMRFNIPGDSYTQRMSDSGCGPVAAATVVNGLYGRGLDPKTAAQYALNNGFKEVNGGTVPEYFGSIFNQYGINSRYETSGKGVVDALQSGRQVVLMGSGGGNTPYGKNPHYVVATGMDGRGNLIIEDPGSRKGALKYNKNSVLNKTSLAISAGLGKARTTVAYGTGEFSSTAFQDLGKFSKLTAADINAWIDRIRPDSPFAGNGYIFIDASNQTGLDPRYILAHAALESGWGLSDIARDKHNYFGIHAFDNDPYNSALSMGNGMREGIVSGAKWIKKNYYDKGQTTLYLMIYGPKRYATAGDSWITEIASIMDSGPKNSNPSLIDTPVTETATTNTTTETKKTPGVFDYLNNIATAASDKLSKITNAFSSTFNESSVFGPLYDALYGKEEEVTTTTDDVDVTAGVAPATASKLTDFFLQTLPGSRISSYYNQDRTDGWPNDIHHGTDFAVSGGTPVLSPVDGEVIQSQRTTGTYDGGYGAAGEAIKIKDKYGYIHCFFHLKERKVKLGDKVKYGDVIGLVGTTGNSSGNHLHYELRSPETGTHMSPADYPHKVGQSIGVSARGKITLNEQTMPKLNYVDTTIKQPKVQQATGAADSSDNTVLLKAIIETLIIISRNSDNLDTLNEISAKLTEYFGDDKNVKSTSSTTKTKQKTSSDTSNALKLVANMFSNSNNNTSSSGFGDGISSLRNKDIETMMSSMYTMSRE